MDNPAPTKKTFSGNMVYCSSGSRKEDILEYDSKHKLVKTGERDLQEEYDAAAVGVTPYECIERLARGQGIGVVTKEITDDNYGDFTGIYDRTHADLIQAQEALRKYSDELQAKEKIAKEQTELEKALAEIEVLKAKLGENNNE
ncbi:hypothetical protein [Capybara microvirus Cap3_SP_449]|nr:hypothetical protein [Capybara microvirus Cap3_SP_449]